MRTKKTKSLHQLPRVESLENRILLAADVVGLSPADDATDVPVNTNLVATFSDPIRIGPGTGNIVIHNVDDNSVIEAINVRSDQVTIDGATITIDPSQDLPGNANISVQPQVAKVRDLGTEVTTQTIFFEDFEGLDLRGSNLVAIDDYALTMTGVLNVEVAGTYTFGVNSDDGQELAIDVAQDGLDLLEDEIIFDNNNHGREDRLSTCAFEDNDTLQSCEGDGDPGIDLAVGEYEFLYLYYERGGGSGGEFFYAPGTLEAFDENEFVLVGDASKGIGVTGAITTTTYKSPDGEQVGDLPTAESLVGDESLILGTAELDLADVAENAGGRFGVDNQIPGNDVSGNEDWTDEAPFGWERDNSFLDANRPGGQPEYNGWTFLSKDFWIEQQGDQNRTQYTDGEGTVAVVDPDAFDDFLGINSDNGDNATDCEPLALEDRTAGGECGYFTAGLSTPTIYLDGVAENSATLRFDSSWRDETTQSAEATVEFFDADGNSMGENVLLRWESIQGDEFKDDTENEEVSLPLNNPADAASFVVTFSMPYAQNDWWWAIDNIEVTANVEGIVSAGISDATAWNFSTGEGGGGGGPVAGPAIDVSTGTAAQSSQLGDFVAGNALDDVANFTHTLAGDENPTWQVELSDSYAFDSITVFNRGASEGTLSCCPSRLRDITIQVVAFDGDVATDFTGGTVVASSDLLNPENELGGGTDSDGPMSLDFSAGGAVGNLIRVIRTVDDDLSGTGGAGNPDEGSVLSIDLVTATGTLVAAPAVDITSPGDALERVDGENDGDANDGPPPASETVEHVIDDVTQKHLNFLDLGSGFIVTPSVGPTNVTGLRLYSANDAIPRDPASYVLEGGNSADGPFTLISEGDLALPDARNAGGDIPITLDLAHQEISFANDQAYAAYRLTFPTLKDAEAANSLQIAEVEFLGTVADAPDGLASDINGNGEVDFNDFLALAAAFGETVDPPGSGADINGNGEVDFADFLALAADFGKTAAAVDAVFGA